MTRSFISSDMREVSYARDRPALDLLACLRAGPCRLCRKAYPKTNTTTGCSPILAVHVRDSRKQGPGRYRVLLLDIRRRFSTVRSPGTFSTSCPPKIRRQREARCGQTRQDHVSDERCLQAGPRRLRHKAHPFFSVAILAQGVFAQMCVTPFAAWRPRS